MDSKPWLQSYPAGVPHEVHPEQYRSLAQMFDESFQRHAERPFSVCMERWTSYADLDRQSKALGAWLQSLGLEPGARVAIMLPNIPQFAATMWLSRPTSTSGCTCRRPAATCSA